MKQKVIRAAKPARRAFNPERPLSKNQLLQAQVKHFREAESRLPPEQQTGVDPESIRTEGQASEYIRKVTAVLHPHGARREKARPAT